MRINTFKIRNDLLEPDFIVIHFFKMKSNLVFIFYVLLISLIRADDIKIGYIHTGAEDPFYKDYFEALATDLTVTIEYHDYEIKSDLSDIDSIIDKIKADKVLHIFADELLFSVTDKFNYQSFFVWMSFPYAQESCTKNVIYFSSLIPILMTCIINFILIIQLDKL